MSNTESGLRKVILKISKQITPLNGKKETEHITVIWMVTFTNILSYFLHQKHVIYTFYFDIHITHPKSLPNSLQDLFLSYTFCHFSPKVL